MKIREVWITEIIGRYQIMFEGRHDGLYNMWAQNELDRKLKELGDWISYSSMQELL